MRVVVALSTKPNQGVPAILVNREVVGAPSSVFDVELLEVRTAAEVRARKTTGAVMGHAPVSATRTGVCSS